MVEEGGSITGYYATPENPEEWIKIGAFEHYFDFVSVGLGASNVLGEAEVEGAFESLYEYFEISKP